LWKEEQGKKIGKIETREINSGEKIVWKNGNKRKN
jgi:hypothetical protein